VYSRSVFEVFAIPGRSGGVAPATNCCGVKNRGRPGSGGPASGMAKTTKRRGVTPLIPARVLSTQVLNSLHFSVKLCVLCG
jgi:hypothetical protein